MRCMEKMNLTDIERAQLLRAARSRTVRAADVRGAKLILMLADGASRDTMRGTILLGRRRLVARYGHRSSSLP